MSQLWKEHVEINKFAQIFFVFNYSKPLNPLPMFTKDFVYLSAEINLIWIQNKTKANSVVEFK